MWIEVIAAAMVGISLLWLVFEPLFTRPSQAAAAAAAARPPSTPSTRWKTRAAAWHSRR